MKTGFLFFVADHLLIGQLCTNPKSDRSLLSCLKVTQRARSDSAAVQFMLSTDSSYGNMTIASTLKMQIWIATNNRDVPRVMKTKFPATVMVFGVVSSEGHIMPPHIFEVGLKVMTTGPLPAPSKCKSRRFNAWEHSSTHRTTLWRWWSGSPRLRTPPGRPGPRSSSKRSRQLLMKLPCGQFGRFPEIYASHTQLWIHVWRGTCSVGPAGTRQARPWPRRQRTSG